MHDVKLDFDELQRWAAPHPPGTWLNFPQSSWAAVVDDSTVRCDLPGPNGLAIGQMRGVHIASKAFRQGPDAHRVRLREVRERRRPLVSERRGQPLSDRTVHPGPG